MRMQKQVGDESGFWSALFILVLTALAAVGFSTYTTVRIEGSNVANQAQALQAEYAAATGAYMGLILYSRGVRTQSSTSFTVAENLTASFSIGTSGSYDAVTSSSSFNSASKSVQILLTRALGLKDMAVVTTGNVNRVSTLDSNRVPDPNKLKANSDSIPTIRVDSLRALSTAQGHNKAGYFDAPDGYLGSFMHASGKPNVTYVNGNLEVRGNRTVYGIFVVTGTVTVHGTSRIVGAIYLPNITSTVITGGGDPGESTIEGGIISHGDISGTGNHITVEHDLSIMTCFEGFQKYPPSLRSQLFSWKSI